ncbi:hypothetical protein [Ornithinimicrobium kibberense]|uniref:hypothetical protein n=1 Tax=Ornithinimicrobium kibberense TaxID=282060 RepID=UPI00360A2268
MCSGTSWAVAPRRVGHWRCSIWAGAGQPGPRGAGGRGREDREWREADKRRVAV